MSNREHGGNLDEAVALHGGVRSDWLDLSTGINPVPWPVPKISFEAWSRLPEQKAMERLLEAIGRAQAASHVEPLSKNSVDQ